MLVWSNPPIFESSKPVSVLVLPGDVEHPEKAGGSSWVYPVTLGGAKGRMIYFPVGYLSNETFFSAEPLFWDKDIFLGLFSHGAAHQGVF